MLFTLRWYDYSILYRQCQYIFLTFEFFRIMVWQIEICRGQISKWSFCSAKVKEWSEPSAREVAPHGADVESIAFGNWWILKGVQIGVWRGDWCNINNGASEDIPWRVPQSLRTTRRPLHFLYKILWQFKIIKGSQSPYYTGFGAKPQTRSQGR